MNTGFSAEFPTLNVVYFHSIFPLQVDGVDEVFSTSSSVSLSSTLTLSHLTPPLLTSYSCHASNLVHDNVVSEERTLRETEVPYVRGAAAGIKGVDFRNGTTLELVCEARGESVERLVWRRGDEQLTNQTTAAGSSLTITTNGNNSTLTIVGVTTKETGLIECALTGTESKLVYNVTITVPAQIEYTSRPLVTVAIGDEVRFDCIASGIPPPTIKWLFDVSKLYHCRSVFLFSKEKTKLHGRVALIVAFLSLSVSDAASGGG